MRVHRPLLIAVCLAFFASGACAETRDVYRDNDCRGPVLNGCLSTAEFTGGVGYGGGYDESYGGGGGGGEASASASASAFAFARARASSHGSHSRGGHCPGSHGGGFHGGGHR
jgi:hypothetical protein